MINSKLSHFIVLLGNLTNYGHTVFQTKKVLDYNSIKELRQDINTFAIFKNSLKGIKAIEHNGFIQIGIIEVNRQFNSKADE